MRTRLEPFSRLTLPASPPLHLRFAAGFVAGTALLSGLIATIVHDVSLFGTALWMLIPAGLFGAPIALAYYALMVKLTGDRVRWCRADAIVALSGYLTWCVLTVVTGRKGPGNFFADLPLAACSGALATTCRVVLGRRIATVVAVAITAVIAVALAVWAWRAYPSLGE